MSYLVIARKWRPQTFEDVVGQAHVTRTLQNAVAAGRVAHGYLFTGPRGVGKTSTARILAKALKCEKGPTPHPCLACPACLEVAGPGSVDVIEIDGASNNSVEDVRALREKVQYVGARDRYKVYIIDEVHMLSQAAFNALLKTLEEPPPHVVFIFATTEASKVPATIVSRTQRFDFRRVGSADVAAQLARILEAEGLGASEEALRLVARAGEGSVRDSQTLLDQVISFALTGGERRALRAEDVLAVLGGVQEGQAWAALSAALRGDLAEALEWLQEQYQRGADLEQVLEAFRALLRGLILMKAAPQGGADAELLPETAAALAAAAPGLGLSRLFTALKACSDAETALRYGGQGRLALELLLIELAPAGPSAGLGEIVDELRDLEQRLRSAPQAAPAETHAAASGAPAAKAMAREAGRPGPAPEAAPGPGTGGMESSPAPSGAPAAGPAQDPAEAGEPVPPVLSVEEPAAPKEPDLAVLAADWEALVADLAAGSLNLASAAKDAGLKALEGGRLTLAAVNAFQRKVLEDPSEKRRLEASLEGRYGRPFEVRVSYEPPAPRTRGPKGAPPSPEEVQRLLAQSPELKRVQDLFGGEIVEISED